MGYLDLEEAPAASVAPPRWSPPVAALAAAEPPAGLADRRADAATRWRIRAATIDNMIVYVGYVALCGLLHWRIQSLNHLVVLGLVGIAYHFVLEARSGQTVGKRRYGIRVVSVNGGPAGSRAIAIRSVLRIVDQLPVCYASGLVSMVRTGPGRRQRIGDVAAGTMVVAVDGRALARGTPGWMLPAATILAIVVSAACAYALAQSGHQALDSAQRSDFIAGCQNGSPGQLLDCGCLLNRLEAAGYNTPNALGDLVAQGQSEAGSGRTGAARTELTDAARACRQ